MWSVDSKVDALYQSASKRKREYDAPRTNFIAKEWIRFRIPELNPLVIFSLSQPSSPFGHDAEKYGWPLLLFSDLEILQVQMSRDSFELLTFEPDILDMYATVTLYMYLKNNGSLWIQKKHGENGAAKYFLNNLEQIVTDSINGESINAFLTLVSHGTDPIKETVEYLLEIWMKSLSDENMDNVVESAGHLENPHTMRFYHQIMYRRLSTLFKSSNPIEQSYIQRIIVPWSIAKELHKMTFLGCAPGITPTTVVGLVFTDGNNHYTLDCFYNSHSLNAPLSNVKKPEDIKLKLRRVGLEYEDEDENSDDD